ncbi:MAG: ribosome recycling factor [Clostridiales bacterium]|nr:ribosome recycling factor [Clostridiales bacterium]
METVFNTAKEKMTKTLSVLKSDFNAIRAGRANAAVLDKIYVDYYGSPMPINQLATITVAEARVLTIQPWDSSVLSLIEKAIQSSDLGINPQNDGRIIRLVFPQPTEERRKQLVKDVSKMGEDAKIAIRQVRRDAIEKLKSMKKNSEITEDDLKYGESEVQKITDEFVKKVDDAVAAKEKEIMEI